MLIYMLMKIKIMLTIQYGTVQYTTVQYSTVQYNTVQYSTVQYNTVQFSPVYPALLVEYDESPSAFRYIVMRLWVL